MGLKGDHGPTHVEAVGMILGDAMPSLRVTFVECPSCGVAVAAKVHDDDTVEPVAGCKDHT